MNAEQATRVALGCLEVKPMHEYEDGQLLYGYGIWFKGHGHQKDQTCIWRPSRAECEELLPIFAAQLALGLEGWGLHDGKNRNLGSSDNVRRSASNLELYLSSVETAKHNLPSKQ